MNEQIKLDRKVIEMIEELKKQQAVKKRKT